LLGRDGLHEGSLVKRGVKSNVTGS
jgi:hypothetical protein